MIQQLAEKADDLILNSKEGESSFSNQLMDAVSKDILRISVHAANRILNDDEVKDEKDAYSLENRFKYLLSSAEKVLDSITLTDNQKSDLKNFLQILPLYAVFKNKVDNI